MGTLFFFSGIGITLGSVSYLRALFEETLAEDESVSFCPNQCFSLESIH